MRALIVVAVLVTVSLWASEPENSYFQKISRWFGESENDWPTTSTVVGPQLGHKQEDCQHQARLLSAALLRTENALRNVRAARRLSVASRHQLNLADIHAEYPQKGSRHGGVRACGVSARAGAGTVPWRARAWLWGVLPLPLYRAAAEPAVLLQTSRPLPADCWPFRRTAGEVIIELSNTARVTLLTIEHVRPDSTHSAPATFTLYGILANGTRVTGNKGEYNSHGMALQTFPTGLATPVIAVALQVTSNQGNPRYTCIYRLQVYTHERFTFNKLL